MVLGFRSSATVVGRGRFAIGGEELCGYSIGEEADGILTFDDNGGEGRGKRRVEDRMGLSGRIFSSENLFL